MDDLSKKVARYAKDNLLIISFCNWEYRFIALNWVDHLKKLNVDNYLIIALDKKTQQFLSNEDVNLTFISKWSPPKEKLKGWRERFNMTRTVLSCGVDIIHSDLDAIWLKNPIKFITRDYDLVASTGTFPRETNEKWGFTLCMGWMYYK